MACALRDCPRLQFLIRGTCRNYCAESAFYDVGAVESFAFCEKLLG